MAPNGFQRLPTAPYDYKHTLLLFSSSMTPTDFQRLPLRELTRSLLPNHYSQALGNTTASTPVITNSEGARVVLESEYEVADTDASLTPYVRTNQPNNQISVS